MSRGTVLVTGGAGYVGSHACKILAAAGFEPVTFDNLSTGNRWAVRWGPLELGDLLDPHALHLAFVRHRPCAVLHFAGAALVGESVREPTLYWRRNLVGSLNLVEACRIHGVGVLVFSSTCAVYGTPTTVPITEETPKAPINPYGASKLAVERLLADAEAAFGLRFAALRYFNAAGADPEGEIGEHRAVETHLIPLLLDAILGLRPPLQVLGTDYPTPDGTAIRDYVHVTDLAVAHLRALEHLLAGGASLVCNLGTGEGHSVRQVIEAAERITGRPVPRVEAPRRPGDPAVLVADPGRALRELRLLPANPMGLERILETAWAWHAEHRARRLREG